MPKVRFVPTDDMPGNYVNAVPVEAIPREGETIYLQGRRFRVLEVAHFLRDSQLQGGEHRILVNLEKIPTGKAGDL